MERILHNAYLHKALRSLEGCCRAKKSAIFIYGHSLADNDDHVFRQIAGGAAADLFVSLYGDPDSASNKAMINSAEVIAQWRLNIRGEGSPLKVHFYDAASANVWG